MLKQITVNQSTYNLLVGFLFLFSNAIEPEFSNNFKIFTAKPLSIKKMSLSLQPILDKDQRDINKAVKVIKNKEKCLQFSN
jgi:hypothetical protein